MMKQNLNQNTQIKAEQNTQAEAEKNTQTAAEQSTGRTALAGRRALQKDMTVGTPWKIILEFAIPICIGNIFQQFYSMVDTIIVGKFVGTDALAAVGATGTISFLILGFVMGMTAGFLVPAGQRFGAGDFRSMRQNVGCAILLSVITTVILTAVSCLGMHWMLNVMHTPSDIIGLSYEYIIIICGGMFTMVLYNLASGILRAIGNSRIPLYFLILSATLNIFLDLLFVITFRMSVAGAAWATVISQGISGVACVLYIAKNVPLLRLSRDDLKLRRDVAEQQLMIGIPMALQFSITAIGTVMVQTALNTLGTLYVASYTAASKIESLVTQLFPAEGTTMASYCAQNAGAGKYDRIRKGIRASNLQSFIYAVLACILMITVGKNLTVLFISDQLTQIIPLVGQYLLCTAVMYIPLGMIFIYRNALQGMSFSLVPMLGGVVELAARGIVSVAAASQKSYLGVCMAGPLAWLAAGVFLAVGFAVLQKKLPGAARA
jgi:putative MATE family efflux protein